MKSFIGYKGGKSRLVKLLVAKLPDHICYCEVFAGASWVLFGKEPAKSEAINDINSELITLYRVIKNHLEEFIRHTKLSLITRDEFTRLKTEKPEHLTDIQRATSFTCC